MFFDICLHDRLLMSSWQVECIARVEIDEINDQCKYTDKQIQHDQPEQCPAELPYVISIYIYIYKLAPFRTISDRTPKLYNPAAVSWFCLKQTLNPALFKLSGLSPTP